MATSQVNGIVRHIRGLALPDLPAAADGELLTAFVQDRSADALTALVERHGPMVWGVCRRFLRSHHDAEDAFQATFLVLVRKAATIRDRRAVANWLYGVASQTAVRMRALVAKRHHREQPVMDMPERMTNDAEQRNDLLPFLDQELGRLPAKYRILIVLCDLEGKTRTEAARQLGCPEGTVAGRLARARQMLAKRLARHGLVVSGVVLAGSFLNIAAAAVLPAVTSTTIKAASLSAAEKAAAGAISTTVAALTDGVVKTMLLTKLKTVSAVLLLLGVISATTLGLSRSMLAADQPDPNHPAKEKAAADSSAKTRPAAKSPVSDQPPLPATDLVLLSLQSQLETELRDLKPAPSFEVPTSSAGKSLVMRFQTKEYLVYPRTKSGRLGAELEKREGPLDEGVLLRIHLQLKGDVNQAVVPQTLEEPYWSTFLNVYPVAGSDKQVYVALSSRGSTGQDLIKRIKRVMEQAAVQKE